MINNVKVLGGLLIVSLLPVILLMIWSDTNFWGKVLVSQIILIVFVALIESALTKGDKRTET